MQDLFYLENKDIKDKPFNNFEVDFVEKRRSKSSKTTLEKQRSQSKIQTLEKQRSQSRIQTLGKKNILKQILNNFKNIQSQIWLIIWQVDIWVIDINANFETWFKCLQKNLENQN